MCISSATTPYPPGVGKGLSGPLLTCLHCSPAIPSATRWPKTKSGSARALGLCSFAQPGPKRIGSLSQPKLKLRLSPWPRDINIALWKHSTSYYVAHGSRVPGTSRLVLSPHPNHLEQHLLVLYMVLAKHAKKLPEASLCQQSNTYVLCRQVPPSLIGCSIGRFFTPTHDDSPKPGHLYIAGSTCLNT